MAKYLIIGRMGSVIDEETTFDRAYRVAECRAQGSVGMSYTIAKVIGTITSEQLPSPVVVSFEKEGD